MKKNRIIVYIMAIFAFALLMFAQTAFVRAENGQTTGNITINPSYNFSTGRLSVKGKVMGGSNIRVSIKIINPSDKLLYIGEEKSGEDGSFIFPGPVTYEEGIYKIYVGSEITEKPAVISYIVKKDTSVEPQPGPEPKPVTSPGQQAEAGKPTKQEVKDKIEETLKNIETEDNDKILETIVDIIEHTGSFNADEKDSLKDEIKVLVEKTLDKVSVVDVGKLAEKSGNVVITEAENIKKIEIDDKAINDVISSIEKAYESIAKVLEKEGFNEISGITLSKNKEVRFASEAKKELNFELTVKSIDGLSSKGIALVIDAGVDKEKVNSTSFVIPPKALDLEYITKYLKDMKEEINDDEEIKGRKVSIVIKKVEEKESQKYEQAAKVREQGNATFSPVSENFDLSVMLLKGGSKTDDNNSRSKEGIEIEKFNEKLAIEIPLKEEVLNNINKEKLGVYRYNPETKAWDYVGGKVNPNTKKISFKTNHLSVYAVYEYNKTFKDIEKNWAREYIEVLAAKHIVHGVNDESFQPDRNVTRAEFTKMLLETLDLVDPTAKATFTDVDENAWYYKYVASAQKLGIVKGTIGNRFKPEEIINRQDMAVMAYRAIKAAGIELPEIKEYKEFADNDKIANYAKEAVKALQQADIVEGTGRNMFMPRNNSTRAEAAKIIYKLAQQL